MYNQPYSHDKSKAITMYDLADLHEILHISERTLCRYLHDGRIAGVKIGKKWYCSEPNLKAYLLGAVPHGNRTGYYYKQGKPVERLHYADFQRHDLV